MVAAAGVGQRMGADVPKQYLRLNDRTVLEHTLEPLVSNARLSGVVVAVAADDTHFQRLDVASRVRRVDGGAQRADSVLAALELLYPDSADDWVLVHDAARPCLHPGDLDALMQTVLQNGRGGLLATPVRDTMKRVEGDRVSATVPREGLWHALTPQMFRIGPLRQALQGARAEGVQVTDEAQAMERAGEAPLVVEGRADNIKITRSEDLALAAFFLRRLKG